MSTKSSLPSSFKDFFRSSAVGFSRGKVFLVSKKDYFAMKNTCITEST